MRHLGDERVWQLIQTQPKASPYGTPLAHSTAWFSSSKLCTVMTGPKISFWIFSSSWRRPSMVVGS